MVEVVSFSILVGVGFRPQPLVDSSLIEITNDLTQQTIMASSLLLFRNVFLLQNSDAQLEQCSAEKPAATLPPGTACAFNWFNIVADQDHPCSDNNLYGFKYEQPCILIKLNKVNRARSFRIHDEEYLRFRSMAGDRISILHHYTERNFEILREIKLL